MSLEALLTLPEGFALTKPSGLQTAIARAADGVPIGDALDETACERHFGCSSSRLGLAFPVLVVIVAGVRSGKSFMAACAMVKAALTADLGKLLPHETARGVIVAPTADNARATFRLLVGALQQSPTLKGLIEGEPTSDTLFLRRPDGRLVELVVVAALRGAVALRSRWLFFVAIEECAFFVAEALGAVVNAEEILRAGESRLLPGGQVWVVSSPNGPTGLLHDLHKEHFGKPGRELVIHAPTVAMNPAFDVAQVEALRKRDPDAAAREYDAAWIEASTSFFNGVSLERATRKAPLVRPPEAGHQYAAAIDPATRGNAWTLVVGTREGDKRIVVLAREWKGSRAAPLDPDEVFEDIAKELEPYGVKYIETDAWSIDAMATIARRHGLALIPTTTTGDDAYESYTALRTRFDAGEVELPPVEQLLTDLRMVQRVVSARGYSIRLPRTGDGRHCDFAPATVLALARWLKDAAPAGAPEAGSVEALRAAMPAAKREFLKRRADAKRERNRVPWQLRTPLAGGERR